VIGIKLLESGNFDTMKKRRIGNDQKTNTVDFFQTKSEKRDTMFVEHIAIWVRDLEKMAEFYETYFGAQRSEKYHNTKTGFQSYFLRFDSGSRIELTTKQHLHPGGTDTLGYTHLAMALKSQAEVDAYAQRFVADGFPLLSGPRTTGDGYYEAVIQDPEGNLIEITVA
jgi:lactoylglutathione lyase